METEFMEKVLSFIYVDDISFGSDGVQPTYGLYQKAKSHLKEGIFCLHKFITNSKELHHLIAANEQFSKSPTNDILVKEEDQSYMSVFLEQRQLKYMDNTRSWVFNGTLSMTSLF